MQAAAVATAVGRLLARLDPAHADACRAAASAFGSRLAQPTKAARAIYASVPGNRRVLVSNHDAYRYLARRFGFDVLGSIVPGRSTAAVPSPSRFADLAATMRQRVSEERARGATVLVATHQLTVALRCDLAVLLDRRVVAFGPPADACEEANLVRAFGLLDDLAIQSTARLLLPDHTATRPLVDTDEATS